MNNILASILIIILLVTNCFANEIMINANTIHIKKGERIVGVNIKVNPATFVSIYGIQNGWNINVDNDPSWASEIKSEIIVGAAALDLKDVGKIKFGIETMEPQQIAKVSINGIIYVSKDFEKTREIRLKKNNFIVTGTP